MDGVGVYADGDGFNIDVKDFGADEEGKHGGFGCVEDEPGLD